MRRYIFPLFSLVCGLFLMAYSWIASFPLSVTSTQDYIFNNLSIFYWIGLPIVIVSLYFFATSNRSKVLTWASVLGIVLSMISLTYFYALMPGSDSHYFRGLSEYFLSTGDLKSSIPYHSYYQWPVYFELNKLVMWLFNLSLTQTEFLLFTLTVIISVTSLYVYFSSFNKKNGYFAVLPFFVIAFSFLNLQWVPYTFAFSLLLLLFALEASTKRGAKVQIMELLVFTIVTFAHVYVPVFFIIYLLIMLVIRRDKKYAILFALATAIYFTVLMTRDTVFLARYLPELTNIQPGSNALGKFYTQTAVGITPSPLDAMAQQLGRLDVIFTGVLCGVGFLILFIKRNLRSTDKAIFLTGVIYTAVGFLIPNLSERAIPIILLPLSLGASKLLESRFKSYVKALFLISLILFLFMPMHQSFYLAIDGRIQFQTVEAHQTADFIFKYYNLGNSGTILSSTPDALYLTTRSGSNATFVTQADSTFPGNIDSYDAILYSVGLEKNLAGDNISQFNITQDSNYDIIYNSGPSSFAVKNR